MCGGPPHRPGTRKLQKGRAGSRREQTSAEGRGRRPPAPGAERQVHPASTGKDKPRPRGERRAWPASAGAHLVLVSVRPSPRAHACGPRPRAPVPARACVRCWLVPAAPCGRVLCVTPGPGSGVAHTGACARAGWLCRWPRGTHTWLCCDARVLSDAHCPGRGTGRHARRTFPDRPRFYGSASYA